jgi:hypothetical protein
MIPLFWGKSRQLLARARVIKIHASDGIVGPALDILYNGSTMLRKGLLRLLFEI